jgi:hypothetical protein
VARQNVLVEGRGHEVRGLQGSQETEKQRERERERNRETEREREGRQKEESVKGSVVSKAHPQGPTLFN